MSLPLRAPLSFHRRGNGCLDAGSLELSSSGRESFPRQRCSWVPLPSPGHPNVPAGTAPFFTHGVKEQTEREKARCARVTPGLKYSYVPFAMFFKVGHLVHITVTPPVQRRVGLANTLHRVHLSKKDTSMT